MKYFIQLEVSYNKVIGFDEDGDPETECITKKIRSELFDTEKDAIKAGNELIESNLWVEQFPGLIGRRLERRFGYPLVVLSLKNGAKAFISVGSIDEAPMSDLNNLLLTIK